MAEMSKAQVKSLMEYVVKGVAKEYQQVMIEQAQEMVDRRGWNIASKSDAEIAKYFDAWLDRYSY